MDRLERLLNLVAALIDTERPLTAEEIAEKVPGYPAMGQAFKRAFERDKSTLRSMGVPLDVVVLEPLNPESPQGYRVRRQRYELPDPGLEPDEVAALHLAATSVRLDGGDATAAVWKLGGVPGADVLGRAGTASIPGSDHLEVLFTAAAERRTVCFAYRGATRTVDPWRLEFRNGQWYLVGLDHDRGEQRAFRLDRFTGAPDAGPAGAFEAPGSTEPVAAHPWEVGDEEPVDVRVRVDADQAGWAVANAGTEGERQPDGSVVLTLRATNRAALRSWVLGFLDHAEVLAPDEERAAIAAWLEDAARRWACA
ncbi:MAG TPA: WYL domain-containing protein [Acidimicrobiales bacterium]|nr:WYL domain-containing protein [Acidimicrobiales bacterium]